MKALLILLAILGAACASPVVLRADESASDPLSEYIIGFWEGINSQDDVNKVLECAKGGELIIEKLTMVAEYLSNPYDIQQVMKGFMLLIEATYDLYSQIKPCSEEAEEFNELMKKIMSTNISTIITKLIAYLNLYISYLWNFVKAIKAEDYKTGGLNIGKMLYKLFLATSSDDNTNAELVVISADEVTSDPLSEYVAGFWIGINDKEDVNKVLECVKGGDPIMEKLIKAMEYLYDPADIESIVNGFTLLIDATYEIYEMIKPCTVEAKELHALIKKMMSTNKMTIIMKLIININEYIVYFCSCIEAFRDGNYKLGGINVGKFLHRLYIVAAKEA